jgi:hypothetical protein
MEEDARTLDLRPFLAIAAAVAVALTLWASGAFAAGGSSSGDSPGGDPSARIQSGEDDQTPRREDCPKDRGGSGGSGGNSGGSDAPSL